MNYETPTFEEFHNLNESLDNDVFGDVIDEASTYEITTLTEDELLGGVKVSLFDSNDDIIVSANFVSEEVAKVYLEELWDMKVD